MGQGYCDLFSFTKLKKRLHSSGKMSLEVVSGSMLPLIPVGSSIDIRPIIDELKPFDIVVFWDGDKLISHYIWKKSAFKTQGKDVWLTRSLQNPENNDLPVEEDRILGIIINFNLSGFQKFFVMLKAWKKGRL